MRYDSKFLSGWADVCDRLQRKRMRSQSNHNHDYYYNHHDSAAQDFLPCRAIPHENFLPPEHRQHIRMYAVPHFRPTHFLRMCRPHTTHHHDYHDYHDHHHDSAARDFLPCRAIPLLLQR